MSDDPLRDIARARTRIARAQAAYEDAIRAAVEAGLPQRKVAEAAGISQYAVWALLNPEAAERHGRRKR